MIEFFDPPDSGNQRIVPLLKEHARPSIELSRRVPNGIEASVEFVGQSLGSVREPHESADDADHLEDAVDGALVERHDGVATTDQFGGDVGL